MVCIDTQNDDATFFFNQKPREGFITINRQHDSTVHSVNTSSVHMAVSHIT